MIIRTLLMAIGSIITVSACCQQPIQWSYSAKKIGDKVYEVHLTAVLHAGWHIYSQSQPAEAVAEPTKISFTNNPLFILDGTASEIGDMKKHVYESLGITQNEYADKVDFVQRIKLKAAVKTSVSGTIAFQACTNQRCLAPDKASFSIPIRE